MQDYTIVLHNLDRIKLEWTKRGSLHVQVFSPGMLRDGHGLLLRGSTILDGDELQRFLNALTPPAEVRPAA